MRGLSSSLSVIGLSLLGCNQASRIATTPAPSGTYTLITINGNELPFTPPHEGGAPEVVSSTFTLNTDGTFDMKMAYATPQGAAVSRDFSGTYTWESTHINFQWHGAGRTSATFEGNSFTMDNEGVLFFYRR